MSEYIIDMGNSSYQSTSGLLCADVSQLREEIVRCLDCADFDECNMTKTYSDGPIDEKDPDGFCAWGKRRERESTEVWNQWSTDDVTCWEVNS